MARILLVDDDRELLQIASALLTYAKHDVLACDSAADALEVLRRQQVDVVITDANMTPHSGFDLIRSIRLLPDSELIPIAMLTGRREKRDVERALAAGAQDYIVKPLDPDLFLKKVSELVATSENSRRIARFAELKTKDTAKCEFSLVVVGLNENGVLLDSDQNLHTGSIVTLSSDLFTSIGVPHPQFRVTGTSPGTTVGSYEVRATFHAIDEKQKAKIRHYVQARVLQNQRSQKAS